MTCPHYSSCKGIGNTRYKNHYSEAYCPLFLNDGESTINDNVRLEEIRGKF